MTKKSYIGMIRLLQGDCLEIMPELEENSVDLIIADPPYGTTQCNWDSIIPFEPMWKNIKRIIKNDSAIILFSSQPFTTALIYSNIENYKYGWVWNKKLAGNAFVSDYQPLKIHEDINVFSYGSAPYYPIMTKGKLRKKLTNTTWNSTFGKQQSSETKNDTYKPKSILVYHVVRKGRVHPTQKSVDLCSYLIKTYTKEKEIVLDFCMGSGTTGIACKATGRDFIGIELNEHYFEIAEKRINAPVQKELL
jgi:site-specific DNA-methyltransferase (adenine-specific)